MHTHNSWIVQVRAVGACKDCSRGILTPTNRRSQSEGAESAVSAKALRLIRSPYPRWAPLCLWLAIFHPWILCLTGAQVLYRLQPELRDKAVGYVTDLSDQLKGRTLEVCIGGGSRGAPGARAPPTSLKWGKCPPFWSHAYQYCIIDYVGFSVWILWISMFSSLNFNSDLDNQFRSY